MSEGAATRRGGGKRWRDAVVWTFVLLLCVLVGLYGAAFFTPAVSAPPFVAANAFARPWLMVHIAGGTAALLLAPLQLARALRTRWPRLHRLLGRVYVAACVLGGVAGVILAAGASAGGFASAGFGLLGVAWLGATLMAWRAALARRLADHRAWMLRSFALTFAAVTLRIYMPLSHLMAIPLLDAYRAIAFLCWVPNLIAAELYVRRTRGRGEAIA